MGGGACGGKYCFDDGIDSANGDHVAAIELWGDEHVVYGSSAGFGVAVIVLYGEGTTY